MTRDCADDTMTALAIMVQRFRSWLCHQVLIIPLTQPPATVITADLDPVRDEGDACAYPLAAAGVDVRLHRMRGSFRLLWLATKVTPHAQDDLISLIATRMETPCHR